MNDIGSRHGVIELSHPVDVFLRVGARVVLAVAIVVFLVALLSGNLPNDPEGGALTEDILVPLQFLLLVFFCHGSNVPANMAVVLPCKKEGKFFQE